MVIFEVTLCNIRMLQSVSHIYASRQVSSCQIFVVLVLLDQAHQMQLFDTSFVDFGPGIHQLRDNLVNFWSLCPKINKNHYCMHNF